MPDTATPERAKPQFAVNTVPRLGERRPIAKAPRLYPTFEAAEKVARANLARGSDRTAVIIVHDPWEPPGRRRMDVAAFVRADALGRVWTDLESVGARFV
jgi:hypothetical protein